MVSKELKQIIPFDEVDAAIEGDGGAAEELGLYTWTKTCTYIINPDL